MSRDLWITKQYIITLRKFPNHLDQTGTASWVEHTTSESFCYVLVRKSYLAFDWAPTLGARGPSCAVSGFGQVLKSDLREPLVSSAFGRTRVCLQPTKRSSPSHARKNLWYPGYWSPGNSNTVCSVCGERSWSHILASFFNIKKYRFSSRHFSFFRIPHRIPDPENASLSFSEVFL